MMFDEQSKMEVDEHMSDNLNQVLQSVKRTMRKHENWYLVDKKWFEQCEQFIGDKEPTHNPGPIDNSNLFKTTNSNNWELKEDLDESLDYQLVPEEVWKSLVDYFGIRHEAHTIERLVIDQGSFSSYCMVEVYPIELKLCHSSQPSLKVSKQYSRVTTLHELEEDMKVMFKTDSNRDTQIHQNTMLLTAHKDKLRDELSTKRTLAEASISSGDTIVLEIRNEDGTWPSVRTRITRNTVGQKSFLPGRCGLANLGNTCFMNSALQCLSNTPPLTEFIMSDKYLNEINVTNPLGMKGKIAKTYGDMIKNMWSGTENCFTPREFKYAVGCFAPQFSGYAQQDCQELMAFLLDGLHEDLNRIKNKPYIEIRNDIDKRPDDEVAKETWENYKKRNDSIIVDTFHGLLKSTLVCPDCELVSVTFDPFCYLSLPLPVKRDKQIDVIFVPAYTKHVGSDDTEHKEKKTIKLNRLLIPKYGSISDISKAVAKAINDEKIFLHKIEPSKLLVTEVYNHRFHKVFENDEPIVPNQEDLVIYEMFDAKFSIPVYLREAKPDGTIELFGRPFLIGLEDSKYETIYNSVLHQLRNSIDIPVSGLNVNGAPDSDEENADGINDSGLFSISLTNSFGTMELDKLNSTKTIEVNKKSYFAVNFPTTVKNDYFNESELKNFYKLKMPKTTGPKSIPLSECIMNFTTTEKLGVDDPWYCPNCKKHQQATKKFDLWNLPNVLIIHLKRFSYSRFWRDKLDALVDFPVTGLNMGKYVINNPDKKPIFYDLIAVANHYGGLGGGHYTAFGKNCQTHDWYYFNDASVTLSNEEEIVSSGGYVLFYLKRT